MLPLPNIRRPWRLMALPVVLVLGSMSACGDPCRDLSDTVCNCMPTRAEQQACRKRVHNLAAQSESLSSGERKTCQDLLQSCSCEALKQGNFAACGLAQESAQAASG